MDGVNNSLTTSSLLVLGTLLGQVVYTCITCKSSRKKIKNTSCRSIKLAAFDTLCQSGLFLFPCDKFREFLLDPARVFRSCSIWVRRGFAHIARDALVAAFQPITGGIHLAPSTFLFKLPSRTSGNMNQGAKLCVVGWEVSKMSWEGSMGVDSKAEANTAAVLRGSFALRTVWPCVLRLPVPFLGCIWLCPLPGLYLALCGETWTLQINLDPFLWRIKAEIQRQEANAGFHRVIVQQPQPRESGGYFLLQKCYIPTAK